MLTREAAEIALKEYKEGIFKQEKKSCETEIKFAGVELENAQRAIPQARERYAKFKQVKTGSAANLARKWQLETGESVAQLNVKRAQLALDQAQSKLTMLLKYEKKSARRRSRPASKRPAPMSSPNKRPGSFSSRCS